MQFEHQKENMQPIIDELPAQIIHSPQYYPEYCSDYYALFFKDSEGIEVSIEGITFPNATTEYKHRQEIIKQVSCFFTRLSNKMIRGCRSKKI